MSLTDCPDCDKGWRRTDSGMVPCSCRIDSTARHRMAAGGVPERYQGYQLSTVPDELKKYAAGLRLLMAREEPHFDGALITGPVGRGKSGLAACACRWYADIDEPVAWLDVEESAALDRKKEFHAAVEATGLLVLDDLGAEHANDWSSNAVSYAIKRREARCLPTVVTTNLTRDEIEARYGDRVSSRLADFPAIELRGDDLRKTRARAGRDKATLGEDRPVLIRGE